MNCNKLNKIIITIESLRASGNVRANQLESIAKKLGREKCRKKSKEPMWCNDDVPCSYPLSIPHHGKSDMAIGTKNSILTQLENQDVTYLNKLYKCDD